MCHFINAKNKAEMKVFEMENRCTSYAQTIVEASRFFFLLILQNTDGNYYFLYNIEKF